MNDQTLQSDLPTPKRPLVLTLICIWYSFLFSWQLIELVIFPDYEAAVERLPTWFVMSQLMVLYPAGFMSMLGIWQMRRWGPYLFCTTTLANMAMMYYGLHLLPSLNALLSLLVVFLPALIYLKKMR